MIVDYCPRPFRWRRPAVQYTYGKEALDVSSSAESESTTAWLISVAKGTAEQD